MRLGDRDIRSFLTSNTAKIFPSASEIVPTKYSPGNPCLIKISSASSMGTSFFISILFGISSFWEAKTAIDDKSFTSPTDSSQNPSASVSSSFPRYLNSSSIKASRSSRLGSMPADLVIIFSLTQISRSIKVPISVSSFKV